MIVAQRKPINEIIKLLENSRKILVLGCGTCVTVCEAGGEKEVAELSALLRLAMPKKVFLEETIERQCDREFFEKIEEIAPGCDTILSLACGVGVQLTARVFEDKLVFPALNTQFMGINEDIGCWTENCLACGDCKLGTFGAVCPVTRCSKHLSNGPCGGSVDGMCEVDPENIECGWQMIYDRMERLGRLEDLEKIEPPKDWSKAHDGGPRKIVREDLAE